MKGSRRKKSDLGSRGWIGRGSVENQRREGGKGRGRDEVTLREVKSERSFWWISVSCFW
jgi:hypothetical protein